MRYLDSMGKSHEHPYDRDKAEEISGFGGRAEQMLSLADETFPALDESTLSLADVECVLWVMRNWGKIKEIMES